MKFNFSDIENFDKHIEMSIPDYNSMNRIVKELIKFFVGTDGTHLDVGCSTGKLVFDLHVKNIHSIGIDTADIIQDSEYLIKGDYFKKHFEPVNLITSIFFLQFLRETERKKALDKMMSEVKAGGHLIICEKTHFDNPVIENVMETSYLKFKRQHFTAEEILEKKFQLAESMFLKTEIQLMDELWKYGKPSVFWKSYGFMGIIVTP